MIGNREYKVPVEVGGSWKTVTVSCAERNVEMI